MTDPTTIPNVPVVYIAGRFRGATPFDVHLNVVTAEVCGLFVSQCGAMPFMPQANTRNFDKQGEDQFWLDGTLVMLSRCDALMMANGWQASRGAQIERAWAERQGMPIFYQDDDRGFRTWIDDWKAYRTPRLRWDAVEYIHYDPR